MDTEVAQFRCSDCRFDEKPCYECRGINGLTQLPIAQLCAEMQNGSGDLEIQHSDNDARLCALILKLAEGQSASERAALQAAVNTFVSSSRWYA